MKKNILLAIMALLMFSAFNSCKQCYTCTYGGGLGVDVCRASGESQAAFNNRIKGYRNNGYTCR